MEFLLKIPTSFSSWIKLILYVNDFIYKWLYGVEIDKETLSYFYNFNFLSCKTHLPFATHVTQKIAIE